MNWIEVSDLMIPELRVYASLSESELLHYFEPVKEGLFIAESPNVVIRALRAGYEPVSFLLDKREAEAAGKLEATGKPETVGKPETAGKTVPDRGEAVEVLSEILTMMEGRDMENRVPVYIAETEVLRSLTGFPMTRGVLCAFRRKKLPKASELLSGMRRVAVLENVMNPTNLGAIFRSAAALSMDAVLLTKGSTDPLYRRASRVSMGTVFQVPWTFIDGIEELHEAGFKTAAMALRHDTYRIDDPALQQEEKLAVIMGTEGEGLQEKTILESDYTVKIPMSHGVDSLNVASASAIAFWELGKRREVL